MQLSGQPVSVANVTYSPAAFRPAAPTPAGRDEKFAARYGPWALVTGASQGIGAEFARALAEKGLDVVLVARSADKLQALAQELRSEFGVQVRTVPADLAKPEGLEAVKTGTADLHVGLLVNNAGSWQFGSFLDNDIQKDLGSIALNVEAPMVLSHHFGGRMVQAGRGGILNVGSGAGLYGVPGQAAYSATKGFLQNFTQSLYSELKPKGVDVLITNPGPVVGEASAVFDQSRVPLQKLTPRKVALQALGQLGHGSTTIPGWYNKLAMDLAVRAMPRDMMSGLAGYFLSQAARGETGAAPAAAGAQVPADPAAATDVAPAADVDVPRSSDGGFAAFGAAVGAGLGAAAAALWNPVKSLLKTVKFGVDFLGTMRTRAREISEAPDRVEAHLKAQGLHHPYQPPVNRTNAKLQGTMTVRANMQEFFQLWDSWIAKGYGSINDRQYADLVLKFRDQARELPLLAHVPMVSEDAFTVVVEDGKITTMTETTVAKFAGLVPTSKVDWVYQREGTPRGSNSFEHTIDRFDGDLGKVEAFYNDLFDPRKLNPESKATVEFRIQEFQDLTVTPGAREFEHGVKAPLDFLLPGPATTLE